MILMFVCKDDQETLRDDYLLMLVSSCLLMNERPKITKRPQIIERPWMTERSQIIKRPWIIETSIKINKR